MKEQHVDKRNFDVASISRSGRAKRATYVQNALEYDHTKVSTPGSFLNIFSNMFRTKEDKSIAYV